MADSNRERQEELIQRDLQRIVRRILRRPADDSQLSRAIHEVAETVRDRQDTDSLVRVVAKRLADSQMRSGQPFMSRLRQRVFGVGNTSTMIAQATWAGAD